MKTTSTILFMILLLLLGILSNISIGQNLNSNTTSLQTKPQKIDRLINEYYQDHQFMGSVLVADGGAIIFKKGYGLADVEKNIPNSTTTKFHIASITKQFVAMVIAQLVEQGKLRLEDKISDYLPYYRKDIGSKVTVEMLVTHTSGIPNLEYNFSDPTIYDKDEYIKKFCMKEIRFKPGSRYSYSNTGYYILGVIIEKITRKSFEEVVTEQILKPLNMINSGCLKRGLILSEEAHSYKYIFNEYKNDDISNVSDLESTSFTAGNLYSTVEDLFLFNKAISTTKLLSKKYLDMVKKIRGLCQPIGNSVYDLFYGGEYYGMIGSVWAKVDSTTKDSVIIYQHNGGYNSFRTHNYNMLQKGRQVIIFGNDNCTIGDELVIEIFKILDDQQISHPKKSLLIRLSAMIKQIGIVSALEDYKRLKDSVDIYKVPSEDDLNRTAYDFLNAGMKEEALALTKFIVDEYPQSWNACDSYAEMLLMSGDKARAIKNYEKSLKLKPDSKSGIDALKKLKGN